MTFQEKITALCRRITEEQLAKLERENLGCEANRKNAISTYKINKKYTYVDIGTSGRYIVENATEKIYGIKAYGVIHRRHYYGTLDEFNRLNWGGYTAFLKKENS